MKPRTNWFSRIAYSKTLEGIVATLFVGVLAYQISGYALRWIGVNDGWAWAGTAAALGACFYPYARYRLAINVRD